MILILSQGNLEETTNSVIDWLNYYNAPYKRINGSDLNPTSYNLEVHNNSTEILNLGFDPKDVKVVWYRRWGDFPDFETINIDSDLPFSQSLNKYLYGEYHSLSHSFFNMFNHAYWLSYPSNRQKDDKIKALKYAQLRNIKIPNTYILSDKSSLLKAHEEVQNDLITKSIYNVNKITTNDKRYMQYTQLVNKKIIDQLPEIFFPSLFQANIEKVYELRVFYLDKKFYSMAIFSQNDNQTKVDFRKYNFDRPNRTVPYKLPLDLEKKLILLMDDLNLETGSIDIIKSTDGEYIFLEVNPIGQFGMVSFPCNYNLERTLAEYLIKKHNEIKTEIK